MTIITKDVVLDPMKHMVTSQNAMCHNLFFNQKKKKNLSNQILPRASLLT
jgi:hypothetical protein